MSKKQVFMAALILMITAQFSFADSVTFKSRLEGIELARLPNIYLSVMYQQEYQKKVKSFFSLFLDNTLPVRIEPVFFEIY